MQSTHNPIGTPTRPPSPTRRSKPLLSLGIALGTFALAVPMTVFTVAPATAADTVQTLKVKAIDGTKGTYSFEGLPTTLKGGNLAVELTNTGKEEHDLAILRIEGKHSMDEVMKIINSEDAPTPSWLHANGGTGRIPPGQVGRATVNLGPGTYMFACTVSNETTHKSHAAGGMMKMITVTGPKAATLPAGATGSIVAKEYGFETKGLKAGKNVVEFSVAGKELHHFLMFPLMPGKTIQDAIAFLSSDKPPSGPPPVNFDKGQNSSVIEKSEGAILTEINLTPGRWAMVCFMTDRAGGPPHIMKGMALEVVIK
jgi:hypothetical protein